MTPKAQATTVRNRQIGPHRDLNLLQETQARRERRPAAWEEVLANHAAVGAVSGACKELPQLN